MTNHLDILSICFNQFISLNKSAQQNILKIACLVQRAISRKIDRETATMSNIKKNTENGLLTF